MEPAATSIRFRVLCWLGLAAGLSYLCRNAVGVAESTIRLDLGLSLEQSGWFMGAFFWTYAAFQIPSGWFAQYCGTRFSLACFAFLWSLATLGISFGYGFWTLCGAQMLMGVVQAGIFPAACNSIGHWMPLSSRSFACGLLAAGMQVGAIVASTFTGPLLLAFGWRSAFALFALPGIIWAIIFAIRFRNHPHESTAVNPAELALIRSTPPARPTADKSSAITVSATPRNDWAIFLTSTMWLLCGQQVFRSAGYMFFASWFPTFLQQTRGVSIAQSGFQQGMVLAGSLLGAIVGGMVTDWVWRRTKNLRISRSGVGATALATCSLLIGSAWFVADARFAVGLIAAGAFFAALAGPCAFAATIDIGGSKVPQVFGMMNMCGNVAAAVCPVAVARIVKQTGNWDLILLLFAAVYLCGAACWVMTNTSRQSVASSPTTSDDRDHS